MRRQLAVGLFVSLLLGVVLGALALHHALKIRLHEAHLGQLEATVDASLRALENGLAAGLTLQSAQLIGQAIDTSAIQQLGHVSLSVVAGSGVVIASNSRAELGSSPNLPMSIDQDVDTLVVEREITTAFGTKAAQLVGTLSLDEVRDDQVKLLNRVLVAAGTVWLVGMTLIGLLCWLLPLSAFARAEEIERSLKKMQKTLEIRSDFNDAKPTVALLWPMFERTRTLDARLRDDALALDQLDGKF